MTITDDTGVFQHCLGRVPAREHGYTTDDVSRALIVVVNGVERGLFPEGSTENNRLVTVCLSFILHAQRLDGWFRNLLSFDRRWLDEGGSEDCFGRTVWALARCVVSPVLDPGFKFAAEEVLKDALPWAERVQSVRGRALTILGLAALSEAWKGNEEVRRILSNLADSLASDFQAYSSPGWRWFEEVLTYANAQPAQALYVAYMATGQRRYLEVAEEAADFLWEVTFDGERFVPVGSRGWYPRGGRKALWAQQSIEAGCAVEAEVAAFEATGDKEHLERALLTLEWFTGRNVLGKPLYDLRTGACHDGLEPYGVSENCGAEATISCLAALQAIMRVFAYRGVLPP